jgi:hypothetical protein
MPDNFVFSRILPRLILFVFGVCIVTVWVNYHLESFEIIWIIWNILALIIAVVSLLGYVWSDSDADSAKALLRRILLFFIKPAFLIVLYGVTLVVGNFVTTVTISGAIEDGTSFQISKPNDAAPDRLTLKNASDKLVVFTLTHPFGTSCCIEAPGFMKETFDVYPWIPKQVSIDEDLERMPNLYVRLKTAPQRWSGGFIAVRLGSELIDSTRLDNNLHGALSLGYPRAVDAEKRRRWELEVSEIASGPGSEQFRSNMLSGWERPFHRGTNSLRPGEQLNISFYNRDSILMARADIRVSQQVDTLINIIQ